MSSIKVAVLGATGETGRSIIDGLLESPTKFEIIALTRPASLTKLANVTLQARGVAVVAADLHGPEADLATILVSVDTVISAVGPPGFEDQVPLARAAKAAGVKRFVPCNFATAAPAGGIMKLRDKKEEVLNQIKQLHLPYTVIDVGWWFQLWVPRLPSGRTDTAVVTLPLNSVAGTGDAPSAVTDLRDIGRYVARVVADPRTLNKMVFVYGEVESQNDSIARVERISGEKVEISRIPEEHIRSRIETLKKEEGSDLFELMGLQYMLSWGVRGDNTPEYARYLGYLDGKELYPDLKTRTLDDFYREALEGRVPRIYA